MLISNGLVAFFAVLVSILATCFIALLAIFIVKSFKKPARNLPEELILTPGGGYHLPEEFFEPIDLDKMHNHELFVLDTLLDCADELGYDVDAEGKNADKIILTLRK